MCTSVRQGCASFSGSLKNDCLFFWKGVSPWFACRVLCLQWVAMGISVRVSGEKRGFQFGFHACFCAHSGRYGHIVSGDKTPSGEIWDSNIKKGIMISKCRRIRRASLGYQIEQSKGKEKKLYNLRSLCRRLSRRIKMLHLLGFVPSSLAASQSRAR